jgi:hypothetical protein
MPWRPSSLLMPTPLIDALFSCLASDPAQEALHSLKAIVADIPEDRVKVSQGRGRGALRAHVICTRVAHYIQTRQLQLGVSPSVMGKSVHMT